MRIIPIIKNLTMRSNVDEEYNIFSNDERYCILMDKINLLDEKYRNKDIQTKEFFKIYNQIINLINKYIYSKNGIKLSKYNLCLDYISLLKVKEERFFDTEIKGLVNYNITDEIDKVLVSKTISNIILNTAEDEDIDPNDVSESFMLIFLGVLEKNTPIAIIEPGEIGII